MINLGLTFFSTALFGIQAPVLVAQVPAPEPTSEDCQLSGCVADLYRLVDGVEVPVLSGVASSYESMDSAVEACKLQLPDFKKAYGEDGLFCKARESTEK